MCRYMSGGWKESKVGKMERVAGGAKTSKTSAVMEGVRSNEY